MLAADNASLYHQRVYQPGVGAWNQVDGLNTPNRHGYLAGNPTSFVDAYGLDPDTSMRVRERAGRYNVSKRLTPGTSTWAQEYRRAKPVPPRTSAWQASFHI